MGQVRLPSEFRIDTEFIIPEPGTFYPDNRLHLHPVSDPPVVRGTLGGEVQRVPITLQGQLSIPKSFR